MHADTGELMGQGAASDDSPVIDVCPSYQSYAAGLYYTIAYMVVIGHMFV